MRARVAPVDLHEGLEDALLVLGRDADTGILHGEPGPFAGALATMRAVPTADADRAAGVRKFYRVGEQIREDLLNPLRVADVLGLRVAFDLCGQHDTLARRLRANQ